MKILLCLLLLTSNCYSFFQRGIASWYGRENSRSCTGKILQHTKYPAAAHKTLPIGSFVKITNTRTKKHTLAVIEDRGPYTKNRIIDLNTCAAKEIDIINSGVAEVIVEVIYK
jgi:rare lipoprotein A